MPLAGRRGNDETNCGDLALGAGQIRNDGVAERLDQAGLTSEALQIAVQAAVGRVTGQPDPPAGRVPIQNVMPISSTAKGRRVAFRIDLASFVVAYRAKDGGLNVSRVEMRQQPRGDQ